MALASLCANQPLALFQDLCRIHKVGSEIRGMAVQVDAKLNQSIIDKTKPSVCSSVTRAYHICDWDHWPPGKQTNGQNKLLKGCIHTRSFASRLGIFLYIFFFLSTSYSIHCLFIFLSFFRLVL